MTINERIISAVTPVVSVCVPDFYDPDADGAEDEFCVFSYAEVPDFYCDNHPLLMRYEISVTLVLPIKRPSLAKKNALSQAFAAAGFEVQDVSNTSTTEFQMYEFTLEFTEVLGGLE